MRTSRQRCELFVLSEMSCMVTNVTDHIWLQRQNDALSLLLVEAIFITIKVVNPLHLVTKYLIFTDVDISVNADNHDTQ